MNKMTFEEYKIDHADLCSAIDLISRVMHDDKKYIEFFKNKREILLNNLKELTEKYPEYEI